MSDDYLWDRSGPPDAEIQRLERTLAPLRYRHRAGLAGQPHPRPRAWHCSCARTPKLLLASTARISRIRH